MVWFRAPPAAMGAGGRRSPQRCGSGLRRIHIGRSGCGLTLPPKLSGSASANCAGPESSLDPNDDVRLRCERTARLVFALLERGADWGAQKLGGNFEGTGRAGNRESGAAGVPGNRNSGRCPGPVVGQTERGTLIAPADQLAGAIGE